MPTLAAGIWLNRLSKTHRFVDLSLSRPGRVDERLDDQAHRRSGLRGYPNPYRAGPGCGYRNRCRSVGNPIIVPVNELIVGPPSPSAVTQANTPAAFSELPCTGQAYPYHPENTLQFYCLSRLTCDKNKPKTDQKHIDGTSRVCSPSSFAQVKARIPTLQKLTLNLIFGEWRAVGRRTTEPVYSERPTPSPAHVTSKQSLIYYAGPWSVE